MARIAHYRASPLDAHTRKIDRELAKLAERVTVLTHLRIDDAAAVKAQFLADGGLREPQFRYAALRFDLVRHRQRLNALDLQGVAHRGLRERLTAKRDELLAELTLLQTRGTPAFTRASIALYGRPNRSDVACARRILSLTPEREARQLTAKQVKRQLERFVRRLQKQAPLVCNVRLEENRQSQAAATSRGVILAADGNFSKSEATRLAVHEVGWHVLTSFNGSLQPLHLLRDGTAGYLGDQEGGAVLQELLTPGALSIDRLQTLAARTLAVDFALAGDSFTEVYAKLRALPHAMSEEQAYAICARVFRGGACQGNGRFAGVFTKDALYLRHFLSVMAKARDGTLDLALFAAGKMGVDDVEFVAKAVRQGWLRTPRLLPEAVQFSVEHLSLELRVALNL